MSTVHAIANVQHMLMALKESIPSEKWPDTPLPVIASPDWFIEDVAKDLGAEAGLLVDSIHGCRVIRNDNLQEPMLIDHDGKTYPILPAWQRAAIGQTKVQTVDDNPAAA